ncbi:MAG: recombinase family protein [Candidatus Roizmanbacteria bacterium]|nr:recombinase family protein [Candidatus Roizmanbacteria bacterium]
MEILSQVYKPERYTAQTDIVILPAWIQKRVSTQPQVGSKIRGIFHEKASLEEQSRLCREGIIKYKGNCSTCYKEIRLSLIGESVAKGESGRNYDREDIEEVLKMAKEGAFKVLVTTENDRLARKRSVAATFRDELKGMGVQIYSLSQPLSLKCPICFDPLDDDVGIITETISDMKSQLDLSRIRRNYKIGMPRRIESGKPSGSLAYGLIKKYKVIGKDQTGNDILSTYYVWDETKIQIVKRIAKEYLSGKGVWSISKDLNDEGISSPQGSIWRRSTIICLLNNPVYSGKIRWGWKPVKNGLRKIQPRGKWKMATAEFKGIWPLDYQEKITQEIARKYRVGGRAAASTGLLIGLLKCGKCGSSMLKIKGKKTFKNGTQYVYEGYGCGAFIQGGACRHNGIKQAKLDQLILDEVNKLANDDTRKSFYNRLNKTKQVTLQSMINKKKIELDRYISSYDRVLRAYRNGIDSLEEYAINKEQILPKIDLLKGELIKLELKVQTRLNLSWEENFELAINKFIKYKCPEDKMIVKSILNKLIDRIEFTKITSKERKVKILYRIDTPDINTKQTN